MQRFGGVDYICSGQIILQNTEIDDALRSRSFVRTNSEGICSHIGLVVMLLIILHIKEIVNLMFGRM